MLHFVRVSFAAVVAVVDSVVVFVFVVAALFYRGALEFYCTSCEEKKIFTLKIQTHTATIK